MGDLADYLEQPNIVRRYMGGGNKEGKPMKILKKGKLPGKEIWVGRCGNCGCEIEALREECKDVTSDQREGTMGKVTCPTDGCRRGMFVYPKGEQHP